MARSRRKVHTRVVSDRVIAEIRAALPRVTARTASAIQAEVPAYRGPVLGRRRKHIETAVVAGHRGLGALLQGRARPEAEVDDLFRQMGRAEAEAGHTLEAMRAALDIATREAWDELHLIALTQGVTPHVLGQVVDLLFHQVGHLRDELEVGHRAGLDERAADPHFARERLGRKLLEGGDGAEINELAAIARWGIPERMLIACGPWREELGPVVPELFGADVLVVVDRGEVLVVGEACGGDGWPDEVRAVLGVEMIAVSLPSAVGQIAEAMRLVRRALWLADCGVIPRADVVDCADHELVLWLRSEPMLRDRLAERLLAPLDHETPRRREALARTLMVWLERRPSAPVLARELGLHPQSVRIRLRKLAVLFGSRLADPDDAFAALLALKATLPPAPPASKRR